MVRSIMTVVIQRSLPPEADEGHADSGRLERLAGRRRGASGFVSTLQLFRLRVYSFEDARLLTFKLLVTLQIFITKLDREL